MKYIINKKLIMFLFVAVIVVIVVVVVRFLFVFASFFCCECILYLSLKKMISLLRGFIIHLIGTIRSTGCGQSTIVVAVHFSSR